MTRTCWLIALGAAITLEAACATTPVPAAKQATTETPEPTSRDMGPDNAPQATYYLELAHEELQSARAMIGQGHSSRASMVLARAEADADLARALSEEPETRASAARATEEARALRGSLR